jgi:hypothetical protein
MVRYAAIIYFASACAIHAQTVIVNDNIKFAASPDGHPVLDDYIFKLSKVAMFRPDDPHGSTTGFLFGFDGQKVTPFGIYLDSDGSDWYFVQPGNAFSDVAVAAGQFPVIIDFNSFGMATVGPGEFFLGVRTSFGSASPPGPPNRTAYGWVHLRPENGVLTMVENVMSYNSRGIIVGTTTVVPEPASIALLVLGLTSFAAVAGRGARSSSLATAATAKQQL